MMGKTGKYEKKPFSKARQNISLFLSEGQKKHVIHAALEADVTDARKIMKEYKKKGRDISFTGWIVKCMAQTISERREFNSLKHGRKRIVVFEDVDVAVPVEREIHGEAQTMAYIIRKANEKSVMEITDEIRSAQEVEVGSTQLLGKNTWTERFVINSPMFIKKLLMHILGRNAFLKKRHMGTTAVTSVGMKGKFPGGIIPMGGHYTVQATLGGITKRTAIVEGDTKIREMLNITITIDHDMIDGGPLARFVDRMIELTESAFGLDEFA